MKRNALFVLIAVTAGATVSLAQGPRGPQSQNPRNGGSSYLNMSKLQTIAGKVTSLDVALGMQYPSITIERQIVKLGPAWFLLDQGFEIKIGDAVSVVAAPSTRANDSYLYAVEIVNTNTQARLVLRDAGGVPLWAGGNGPHDAGPGTGAASCWDAASIRTVAGTVERVSMGAGIQMPSLVLKAADGTLIEMKIGPERLLLQSDFELQAGDGLTAKFAYAACADENVALQLTNAAGLTVTLR